MSTTAIISAGIEKLKKNAIQSKFKQFISNPTTFLNTTNNKSVIVDSVWQTKMKVAAITDRVIVRNGGFIQNADIRLASFLAKYLRPQDTFLDLGAGIGYYTTLAALLVGAGGKVFAVEANPETYEFLEYNVKDFTQVKTYNQLIVEKEGEHSFYQYPSPFERSDALVQDQQISYNGRLIEPSVVTPLYGMNLDDFMKGQKIVANMMLMDINGAEYQILNGALKLMSGNAPLIILKYYGAQKITNYHKLATSLLGSYALTPYLIDEEGALKTVTYIDHYLAEHKLPYEYLVFKLAF